MSESIIKELMSENAYLRKELEKLTKRSKPVNAEIESLSGFQVEELANKLKISGILLAEGVWNGVLYTKDEIKKMYEKYKEDLAKLPITVEHERTEEFGDREVGRHTKVEWSDTLGAIIYEGEITELEAIKRIKNGTYNGTSLKIYLERVPCDNVEKGINLRPVNNSLTSLPACSSCLIVSKEELSAKSIPGTFRYYGVNIERNINSNENKGVGEVEMDKKNENIEEQAKQEKLTVEETFELKEDMVAVLPELQPRVREVELEFVTPAEAIKNRRIIYGYYPAGKYPVAKKRAKVKVYYYYFPASYGVGYYPEKQGYPQYYYPQYYYPEYPKYYYPQYPGYYYPQYPEYYQEHYKYPEYPKGPRSDRERLIAHFGKEVAEKLLELIGEEAYKLLPPRGSASLSEEDVEEVLAEDKYKIVKNKKTGKYVVMEATEKGLWKILKQFDTREEAEKFVDELKSKGEEKPGEEKYPPPAEQRKLDDKDEVKLTDDSSTAESQVENPATGTAEESKQDLSEEVSEEPKEAKEDKEAEEEVKAEESSGEETKEEVKKEGAEPKEEERAEEPAEAEVKEPSKPEPPKPALSPAEIAKKIAQEDLIADILIMDYKHRKEQELSKSE